MALKRARLRLEDFAALCASGPLDRSHPLLLQVLFRQKEVQQCCAENTHGGGCAKDDVRGSRYLRQGVLGNRCAGAERDGRDQHVVTLQVGFDEELDADQARQFSAR